MDRFSKIMIISIILIISFTSFSLYKRYNFIKDNIIGSGYIYTGYNIDVQNFRQYEKIITTGFSLSKKDKTVDDFFKIKINKQVKDIQLVADITFTKDFVDHYKYENSPSYFFGLKFFLGDFNNGGYYNVYRKENGGIGNSSKQNLFGAKPANEVRDGVTWYIPLTKSVPVGVAAEKWISLIQFTYFDAEGFLNNNVGNIVPIGIYLSSTSEVKGWNLTYIRSLKIIYVGEKDSIEVIQ